MTEAAQRSGASGATTLASVACFSVGLFAANFTPYFLEALERHTHTDAAGASNLIALEFAAIFVASLAFWRWGRSWSLAWTAYAGIFAYVVGSAATAFAPD